ncbi:hypothetical protein PsorP6_004753 [Peronosclerospora sorghi]|uniref:Uncharacterized protein n=1 Tax=Peronosclerospora sorghi TaxID=230839 RepID=A0ACC0VKF6_9STRA|nr:hypothetical protein PsorP6_004753 [Peronosclerospora sorghi]
MVPIGVMKNKIKAKNNTVLISDSNMLLSMSDRVKLAQTIKEMSVVNCVAGPASIISSMKSGDTSALAGHVVGLFSAAFSAEPAVAPSATPEPAASSDVSVSDAANIST